MSEALSLTTAAIAERRWLNVEYINQDGEESARSILPYFTYVAETTGATCVSGYDTRRRTIRTFRLDNVKSIALGDEAPASAEIPGKVLLFPGVYKLRFAKPQYVNEHLVDKYIEAGWRYGPMPYVFSSAKALDD